MPVHLSGLKLLARELIPWRAMRLVQDLKELIYRDRTRIPHKRYASGTLRERTNLTAIAP